MEAQPVTPGDDGSSHIPDASEPTLGISNNNNNANETPSSLFFRLPIELRREVYQYVLIQEQRPLRQMAQLSRNGRPQHDASALLATDRAIYQEGRPIFLLENVFEIRGTAGDYKWLRTLGPEGQERLRHVTFLNGSAAYSEANHRCMSILSRCPNLCLTIKASHNRLYRLERMEVFKYLHGLSVVTGEERFYGTVPEHAQCVRFLVRSFRLGCPENCKYHRSRDIAGYTATVRVDCRPE